MQIFNVVFHHGGEFVSLNNGDMIYRGGVSTLVYGLNIDKWTMVSIHRLVTGWGYRQGTYRTWTKILEIDDNFFQIMRDDDCYDFAAYACATQVEG